MHDDTTDSPAPEPKPDSTARYTEAELSRIAREAVHQPADARLDKQLARLGLVDDAEATTEPTTQPATPPVTIDPAEVERLRDEYKALRAELDRSILLVRLLIAILAVLGIIVVVLLIR
jgi:hypothetical protein